MFIFPKDQIKIIQKILCEFKSKMLTPSAVFNGIILNVLTVSKMSVNNFYEPFK